MPAPVIALWDKLEEFSKTLLGVEDYPAHLRAEGHGNPAAIMAGHEGAKLLLPSDQPASIEAVYHELLHAHRLWVEAIPELVILTEDENNWQLVGQIEGDLEHLVIIPRQVAAGFAETERLQREARKTWETYPWTGNNNAWARRRTCLMQWMSHHLLEDAELSSTMRDCLLSERIFGEADLFRKKALSLVGKKEDLLACAVRFLKIPMNEVGIRYVDIRNRSFRIVPIRSPR
ncbi:hypothetical protein D3C72_1402820 [compost metagenome]